ncbi:MAG: hypothetical protein DMG82_06125 [Acidobacteria bacterium]|nr:MAG: hypothetical protein DMG82_06125 [Acidobacteriota bacterium]
MISAATMLTVLVGLFLLGIKWTIELVRDWPRKSPMSSYFEQQRSMRNSGDRKAVTKTRSQFSKKREIQHRRKPPHCD